MGDSIKGHSMNTARRVDVRATPVKAACRTPGGNDGSCSMGKESRYVVCTAYYAGGIANPFALDM